MGCCRAGYGVDNLATSGAVATRRAVDRMSGNWTWANVEIVQRISVELCYFGGKFGRVDFSAGRTWLERGLELGVAEDPSAAAGRYSAAAGARRLRARSGRRALTSSKGAGIMDLAVFALWRSARDA